MKIAIDARESGTSSGRYIDKLIEYLHKLQPEYDIVVLTKTPRLEYIKAIAPTFEILESNYKEFTLSEQLGLAWQLYRLRPDLVHFAFPHQPVLYFGKTVTTVHDLSAVRFDNPAKNWLVFKFKQLVYKMVIWVAAHKSRRVIVISKFTRDDLTRFAHIKPAKTVLTYESADKITEPAQPLFKLKDKQFIMYVGRPLPHKNLGRLIDAFATLQPERPGLWLVLAGKKDKLYTRHEKYAARAGLKNILFTDFVSEAQLRWLYENTAAYIFPSLSEGFGLPGLEAMAHGAPVVSSNATCLPEIYGQAAHYFNPKDVADIAAKIGKVLSDSKLRAELVAKGHRQLEKYSWQTMAQQTLAVYKNALQQD